MRLSCLQENLTKGLAVVGRAVPTRTTLPITQNVLLATDRSMLKLSATNLELAITTWIGAMVEEEGALTVPARLLTEFVGSLPSERIDMSTEPGQATLQLACARSEARVNGTDSDEFPPIPTVEEGLVAKIDPRAMRAAISQVVFAAATEESRPFLTGVKLEMEGSQFTLAAADGFRLAVHRGELLEPVDETVSVIVPARAFNELNRFLSDQEDPVEMTLTPAKGQVLFRLKDVEMVSQLIQGTFPNYSQLIPQSYQTRTVFGLQELLRAARSASIFAPGRQRHRSATGRSRRRGSTRGGWSGAAGQGRHLRPRRGDGGQPGRSGHLGGGRRVQDRLQRQVPAGRPLGHEPGRGGPGDQLPIQPRRLQADGLGQIRPRGDANVCAMVVIATSFRESDDSLDYNLAAGSLNLHPKR